MTGEILFYYESMQNPNGDPGFENQPRLMPDETIMVTDVRIKRTMRDYARDVKGEILFVDYDKEGIATTAQIKANELAKNSKDVIGSLLDITFDVPLFGVLIPNTNKNKKDGEKSADKLTGPVQFGLSRSVNKVQIINPTIVGRFQGKTEAYSTLGKFYAVEYALIKVQGVINPQNLSTYGKNKKLLEKFNQKVAMIYDCLWNGTNNLTTRSKYPQRSILYIDVDYKDKIYNDLPNLVDENESLKGMAKSLGDSPFDFSKFISVMSKRKSQINKIRICGAEDISDDIGKLVSELKKNGHVTEDLSD
jgi:CRISPR-associated protein Csh2